MASLDQLRVLVIESQPTMRTQLRAMLASIGMDEVQFAVSAGMAVRRLREQRYDLILCEYNLGDGQDGQHLLEDLRTHDVIPLDTLFVMISSERNYERIVSTAELAPNDYILKPLAAEALRARLLRALDKRDAFVPAWRLMAIGDLVDAIAYCKKAMDDFPLYIVDLMRLQAELHVAAGQISEAETLYREILQGKYIPWARLGLARALHLQKKTAEATEILGELIAENDNFIAAYDLLARIREETGSPEVARDVLRTATERSPYRLRRLRHLGELSLAINDAPAAEAALAEVVRKGKYSDFRDPEDHVRLVQAQLAMNRPDSASATINDLERSMGGQPKADLCKALSSAMLHSHTGNAAGARDALLGAAKAARGAASMSVGLKQELIKACFDQKLGDAGSEMVMDILRTSADERTVESTRALLKSRGLESLSKDIEQRIQNEVKELISVGAEKAHAGDFDGAVAEMMNAARKMPGNPHVLFNAALALLRHIEHRGWNEAFAKQARALIDRARKLSPASNRLSAISEFMHGLIKRYGIRPERIVDTADKAALFRAGNGRR
ncbi:response regulator [Azoarcus sp. L1K30]|uniref:response regulator n=1 Tax=Azoarcus sp. L1K30 TaxID=2820277 RepID=UPI001B8282C4|nr:response regulator [Azoarcus sp. L1K30]MBR0568609.1 response regulator [Azoarcus sp. L1K30]